jgi:hypothetical protein
MSLGLKCNLIYYCITKIPFAQVSRVAISGLSRNSESSDPIAWSRKAMLIADHGLGVICLTWKVIEAIAAW